VSKQSTVEEQSYEERIGKLEIKLKNPELPNSAIPKLQEQLADIADEYQDDGRLGAARYKIYELQALIFFYQKKDKDAYRFLDIAQDTYGSQYEYATNLQSQIIDDNPSIAPIDEFGHDSSYTPLRRAALFDGRLDRTGFLLGVFYSFIPLCAVILFYAIINFLIGASAIGAPTMMLNIFVFILSVACSLMAIITLLSVIVRRWHDMGRTGSYTLFSLIPYVNVIPFAFLFFCPGQKKANEYGHPRHTRSFIGVILGR